MLIQPTKSSHYLKIVYVCSAFFLFTNLLMAQTEGPPPEDLVKVFDYNADVVKNYEITPLDLNQKLEKDSLDLGAQYEVTHLFTNNEGAM